MPRRFIAVLSFIAIITVLAFVALFNPKASASPQELTVISQTRGNEVLTAVFVDNEVRIQLKNNHKNTITAFAISFRDTTIKEDFVYSDIHFGIEPGDTFQKSYAVTPSPVGSDAPPLYLLAVLLKDRTMDGDFRVAQQMRDERLGEKIQILRTFRILEKEVQSPRDLKVIKSEIVAALTTDESETRIALSELQPAARSDNKLSDHLKNGLHWGREKMLRRFQTLEQLPTKGQEQGLAELKDRAQKLLAKL